MGCNPNKIKLTFELTTKQKCFKIWVGQQFFGKGLLPIFSKPIATTGNSGNSIKNSA